MLSYESEISPFSAHLEDITQLPQLFPPEDNDHDEPMHVTMLDFFGTYSPIIMVPQRIKRKKVYIEVSFDQKPAEVPKKKKYKKKLKRPVGLNHDMIKEEDEDKEFFNKKDFIASSCCRADHCHHYAYSSSPNYHSYVAFVDNLCNGKTPKLFSALQRFYKEIHTYIIRNPEGLGNYRSLIDCYANTLKSYALRILNCFSCLIDLIHEVISMHNLYLDEADLRPLGIKDAIDFFFDVDSTLSALVSLHKYNDDIEETANPVENFVYQSLNSCLVACMRGAYNSICEHTHQFTFGCGIHEDILVRIPNTRDRVLHLGYLSQQIQESRNYVVVRFEDETRNRRYFSDGTYRDEFEAWQEFLEVYLNGSLADYQPNKWKETKSYTNRKRTRML